jgi:hypothetical protein
MSTKLYEKSEKSWVNALGSKTVLPFHGCIVLVNLIAMLALLLKPVFSR